MSSIEQAAREYIRLRRLGKALKAKRGRLREMCIAEICPCGPDGEPEPAIPCVFQRHNDNWCVWCMASNGAHNAYYRVSTLAGLAYRRLERTVNQ